MSKNWIRAGFAGLVLALGFSEASAVFDDLPVSSRIRAMGEASVALADDPWLFYSNPATLALLERGHVGSSTVRPNDADFNRLTSLGVAVQLPGGRSGGVALGYRHFGVDFKDVDLATEQTISAAHGFRLFQDASSMAALGWTLNFYNLEFAPSIGSDGLLDPGGAGSVDPGSAWTVGLDLGAVVTLHERTRVGFITRNLNNPTIGDDREELKQSLAGGVAYEPYDDVVTAFTIRQVLGEELRFHGGAEMGITEYLDLRLGIETDPNKLTAGFGVNVEQFTVDYGFSTGGGVLDDSHQFGISFRFNTAGGETP